MNIKPLSIDGLLLCEPMRHGDDRGWFMESYRQDALNEAAGRAIQFVQDNHSLSMAVGTLRGLHYQAPPCAQDKLVRCIAGSVLDVAIDVRRGSASYGEWIAVELSAQNAQQLFVPTGFLHGFVTRAPNSEIAYKVSSPYSRDHDGSVLWKSAGVDWDLGATTPILSGKDVDAPAFADWVSPFD